MHEQFLLNLARERQTAIGSQVEVSRFEENALYALLQTLYQRLSRKPQAKPIAQPQCCPA